MINLVCIECKKRGKFKTKDGAIDAGWMLVKSHLPHVKREFSLCPKHADLFLEKARA